MGIHNNALIGASSQGYTISRSVRLRSSASAYFNQTPTSVGNRRTWTWSAWVKRGIIGNGSLAFAGTLNATTSIYILFTGEVIAVYGYNTSTLNVTWNVYLRDPSAWYHIVVAFDTTQATASNRVKLYINNQQITGTITATYPGINTDWDMGNNTTQYLGRRSDGSYSLDTYLTEINYINGQQLTPSSFGETNAVTGVWQPKRYAGTYGTNGFYLNFSDNSGVTATTIGKDYSGNGNNWTPNNISVTSGVTYDSMLDVPTLYADGGNGRGNYCTLNPLNQNSVFTLSAGNLSFTASNNRFTTGTFAVTSGKWYWEFYPVAGGASGVGVGAILATTYVFGTAAFATAAGYIGVGYTSNGSKYISGTSSAYGATYGSGNVIGVALDLDSGTKTITFYKDNISQGSINLPTSSEAWIVATDYSEAGTHSINFGQRPFTYTPPTGFKALNTQNLPDATIKKGNAYFDATTYTGNGSTQSIVNSGSMQPDFIWFKNRSGANNHALYDSVRGRALGLISNATNAEQSASAGNDLVSFDTSGFSVGPVEDFTSVNGSAQSIIAWQWNAGGSTVTNTDGSISSQVRANPTAGFSVVTFTGTGSAATVGHGLGVAPQMIIAKTRNGVNDWFVYTQARGATKTLYLNLTNAEGTTSAVWNNTAPTSTVFTVGTTFSTNTCVAYCFAAVAGYSAFGSYTGNGSTDGPFVFTGFRPRFVMFKRIDSANVWSILDSARDLYNATNLSLQPSSNIAEETGKNIDFLSNGFKQRQVDAGWNASGGTYIYAAFAENPFKNSLAR